MQLLLINTLAGTLLSADEDTEKALARIPMGKNILVEYKPNRDAGKHKQFFRLLNTVLQNQDIYKNKDDLLIEFKLKAGHYK